MLKEEINCYPEVLVKIQRDHFYSITQTETYIAQCPDKVVTYTSKNINENMFNFGSLICVFLGFMILFIWERKWKNEQRKS